MENILLKYEISPARYHGGKLNEVDCRELIYKAVMIFEEVEELLLSIDHPQRCSSHTIRQRCKVYCDTLITLDLISSKIRIKQGHLKDGDLSDLRRAIANLSYLWEQTGLSFTPKVHGVLAHAVDQVERFGGIGDMLEDDLEHLHQQSKKNSDRTSRIKNKVQQAISHSKMEAKLQNKEIIQKTLESRADSMRTFKKRRTDSKVEAKIERDLARMEKVAEVEAKPHTKQLSFYENEKAKMLDNG